MTFCWYLNFMDKISIFGIVCVKYGWTMHFYLVIQVSFRLQAPIKGLFRAYSTDVLTLHILTFSPKRKSKTKREETLQTASASNFCIASSLHTQLKNGIIPLESFFILWIFWCCYILSFYHLKLCSCSSLT